MINRKALMNGLLAGIISIFIYLMIVVLTTPALNAIDAMYAAVRTNTIIVVGIGVGVGTQMYIATYAKSLGCSINSKRSNSGTILSGFFSFFALVPLGCCGTILYMLSFLPTIIGAGASAVLIEYSQPLAYLGLAIMLLFNIMAYMKLRKQMIRIKR
jgi:hypothetical protein